MKLNPDAKPSPPNISACQPPLTAVCTAVELLHPFSMSATSNRIATSFMKLSLSFGIGSETLLQDYRDAPLPVNGCKEPPLSQSRDLRHELPCFYALRLPFQPPQQLLDPIFFLERGQPIFHVVCCDFGFSLTHSLRMRNLALHPVESRRFRAVADRKASVACLAHGAGTTMLRNQQIGLGLRLRQLLLQLPQGGFQT